MSYNTGWEKWKSTELAGLDCGQNLKIVRQDEGTLVANWTAASTQVLGVGECIGMIRIPAGTQILGADLYWNQTSSTCMSASVLAVGDPYCCGRLLGPIYTIYPRGTALNGSCSPSSWGFCGHMEKVNDAVSDGCGVGYTYTCDTDIVLTNLYNDGYAYIGGGLGAYTVGSKAGAAVSAGKFKLILKVKPV